MRMWTSRLIRRVAWPGLVLLTLAGFVPGSSGGDFEDDAAGASLSAPADDDAEGLLPPDGDPFFADGPQRRGPRPGGGDPRVFKARISPHWFTQNNRFWYRNDLAGRAREFIVVDAQRGLRKPAFDHEALARGLSKAAGGEPVNADRLPFDDIEFVDDGKAVRFRAHEQTWKCDLGNYQCSRTSAGGADAAASAARSQAASTQGRRRPTRRDDDDARPSGTSRSPDGKWTALVKDHNVFVRREGETGEIKLSEEGKAGLEYGRLEWSPDSKALVAFRIEPGDRKEVFLIQSSPPEGGRARLRSRPYALPGDNFTAYELNVFDVASIKPIKPKAERIDLYSPSLHWYKDGRHFAYEKTDRGHQRFRLIEVDAHTGAARNIIDEKSQTFIWSAHREAFNFDTVTWLADDGEVIYVSERDGWRHLYLVDVKKGSIKNAITAGPYVVRGVDRVDHEKRQIWFRASGKNAEQDPYFIHDYRVNFDGTGLVALTDANGSHSVQYSPDRRFLIDTYSRVNQAPVHELRRAQDGKLVCKLEEADISALKAAGWQPPEVFVAKGRDGKTDIWGVIYRPRGYDPGKKYPVVEQIYAGPQGSFVPKTFNPVGRFSFLTDLGFFVVQMDGMGTANRSKAFHDVCWHDLKDAGFPDRILWHQAVARKYPAYDITRVGIYGVSAGGQNATGAVLFHPEFYKVAASACGCHDNRMDKASWNEQWMGYPVGPWYGESSNIDNAHRLEGKLLLIVGEMDTNVPPESTMRLVDALIKAGKDFELVVVPNANHGMGGAYGQRRLRDFLVRHLKGRDSLEGSARPRDEYAGRARSSDRSESVSRTINQDSASLSLDLEGSNGEHSELRGAIERYSADRGSLLRSLPPAVSGLRDRQLREFTRHWSDQLGKMDFDRLSQDGKVDYLLLANHLTHEKRQIDLRARDNQSAAVLLPFAGKIIDLDRSRRELKKMDWAKVAGTLNGLTKEIEDARRGLERDGKSKTQVKKQTANHALAGVESLRGALQGWYGFYDGYDPLFSWWTQEPHKAVDTALQAYAGYLRDRLGATTAGLGDEFGRGPGRRRRPGAGAGGPPDAASARGSASGRDGEITGNPIGREALLSELEYEMISYTPEELIAIARQELAWCEDQMKQAARAMGKGDNWRAALEEVKTQYVEPGNQPALIRDLALEAIAYLDAHDLVTVPQLCRDSWRMDMMSPERQLVNPFFTGGETISVSYPTAGMPHDAKLMSMRGNNIHFCRATVFHELIPGHHLQGFMTARYKTYRGLFNTPFWGEGWALYWELLLWDKEFARSPENRVGMLFWRMHRCARIIFSLSFHLEKMTPKECIDFLVDRIGHERDNATAEVRRSFATSYGPLYQAAYLLGGMQLRALHHEVVESGKMTDRAFHDAILKENSIPIAMVRALLTGEHLTARGRPNWKFHGSIPTAN
jgi:dipeptidyl aminopeptidase/acylaminoacyl peptidase/uncharacterized protein (DUF885 family)